MKKKKEREKEREKSILRLTQQCNIFSRTKGTPVVKNEEKLQQDYKKKTLLKLFFFFSLSLSPINPSNLLLNDISQPSNYLRG